MLQGFDELLKDDRKTPLVVFMRCCWHGITLEKRGSMCLLYFDDEKRAVEFVVRAQDRNAYIMSDLIRLRTGRSILLYTSPFVYVCTLTCLSTRKRKDQNASRINRSMVECSLSMANFSELAMLLRLIFPDIDGQSAKRPEWNEGSGWPGT